MNTRTVQCRIGIDVAHAAQAVGGEQQRLDHGMACAKTGDEGIGGERQGIWSKPFQAGCELLAQLDSAELADIVIDEYAAIERDDRVAMGAELMIHEELAGHAEMNAKARACVGEVNHDVLSAAAYSSNRLAHDSVRPAAQDARA